MLFRKKGKLSERYICLFEILRCVGIVAYKLALPSELSHVHNVFHMSMLWRYMHGFTHVLEYEPLQIDRELTYEELLIQILDRRE